MTRLRQIQLGSGSQIQETFLRLESSGDFPKPRPPHFGYFIVKRAIDVVGAVILIVLIAPVALVIAVAIVVGDRGGLFFNQERTGFRGRSFRMMKFRSMRIGAAEERQAVEDRNRTGGPTFKAIDDPRLTRVGRFIRHYSLDEIPQLIHVLTGEMSLVGPRPLDVDEVVHFPPEALFRFIAKPGLTCVWQTSGRSDVTFEHWMELDAEYVARRSLWLDLKLLMLTPAAVISGRGAY